MKETVQEKIARRTATAMALFKKHASNNATTLTVEQLGALMSELAATHAGEQQVEAFLQVQPPTADDVTFEGLVAAYNAYVEWLGAQPATAEPLASAIAPAPEQPAAPAKPAAEATPAAAPTEPASTEGAPAAETPAAAAVNEVQPAQAFEAIAAGDTDALEAALDAGVHASSELDGVPLVCAAAAAGGTDLLEILLERMPELIDASRAADGATPLMIAALAGEVELVEMLLHHGADVTKNNTDGKRAIDLAATEELKGLLGEAEEKATELVEPKPPAPLLRLPSTGGKGRRNSVSAERVDPLKLGELSKRVVEKTGEERERIRVCLKRSFLFNRADEAQTMDLINAFYEVRKPKDTDIIKQGDREANEFFIIDAGECDVYKGHNADGTDRHMINLKAGANFGELALMYNTARAATVRATTDEVVLWAMDRNSFKSIVLVQTMQKRLKYENFLQSVELLKDLSSYERATIADSFVEVRFSADETVIEEGAKGDEMYFLVSGKANAFSAGEHVATYDGTGSYFGELALLNDDVRKATVKTASDAALVSLDRQAFERLMGPVLDVLKRNVATYAPLLATVASLRG
ncbi:cyclic nucleotide-binding-like protein [Pavlovales sp. CCMP2436]|nr:cyclic nucleotide-binding-like protein [Pavlovales sp. CCMP2436]